MHFVWAGMGASAATLVCVAAALGLMRLTLREQPASMKGMLVAMADPGSNRNPLAPDGRLLMPTASLAGHGRSTDARSRGRVCRLRRGSDARGDGAEPRAAAAGCGSRAGRAIAPSARCSTRCRRPASSRRGRSAVRRSRSTWCGWWRRRGSAARCSRSCRCRSLCPLGVPARPAAHQASPSFRRRFRPPTAASA